VTDAIELRGLRLLGHHGALAGEQDRAQPFEVDCEITIDTTTASRTDRLEDALDYGALVGLISSVVTDRRYALLETIAHAITEELFTYGGVEAVTVTVRKLRPPVPFDLASAGVRIERRRDG
jgi:dihydroneopterin aldolase